MTAPVYLERDGGVAVIVIDNPPINAGSAAVRQGLMDALQTLCTDDTLVGAVLMGAGNTFVAGSDIREFGQPLADPQLPAVIAAIERCHKPVVAALHGAALGGGFELALGCDARVATEPVVVGLPEVTLGIIPGAGGTQRLPRLVGIERAIRMVCAGERVSGQAALKAGLVDALVVGDLRAQAIAHLKQLPGKNRLRDRAVPPADPDAVEQARAQALKAGKHRPAVKAAIDAVMAAAVADFDTALGQERQAFQALRVSREAAALRHQFFAERDSAKHPALAGVVPADIRTVAIIGAGTMGSGIALAVLDAGLQVLLLEQDGEALQRGTARIREHDQARVKQGRMSAAEAAAREAALTPSLDWSLLARADVVIEAVFEDLAVKQQVFARIDALARPGALLASNTSYLDLDAIAAATTRPQDVIGLHFFSPAHVMRLMEVVQGAASSPAAVATGLALGKRLKKLALLTANAFGFVGNRLYAAYRRQCEFLVEEGAWPEQVDAALQAHGFAMGPFAVADLSGLDIAWRMRQAQAATRDPQARYVHIADRLCEAGRLGRKTGAGYYRYEAATSKPQVDPQVHEVIERCRQHQGVVARAISDEEIVRRALLALVNEAALLVAQGVAMRATDVDVALVNGYGFPRWEGGVVFWARERGLANVQQDLAWLGSVSGTGFVAGNAQALMNTEN